jgi:hypothetical protein
MELSSNRRLGNTIVRLNIDFCASDGWLDQFKFHAGIVYMTSIGEVPKICFDFLNFNSRTGKCHPIKWNFLLA